MSLTPIRRAVTSVVLSIGITLVVCGTLGILYCKFWPQQLPSRFSVMYPSPELVNGRLVLPYTDRIPVAKVASYDDEFRAFLYFQFLRGRTASDGLRMLLTATPTKTGPSYSIYVVGQNDLLTDLPRLGRLEGRRLIPRFETAIWSENQFSHYESESHLFEAAYNVPVQKNLENLDPSQLQPALADFLLFKSQTDIRILEDLDPKPQPLTLAQAEQSAADILEVARFYDLPLDYFLGVGAMENDYMDVNGDLEHAVWKKRPQSGDIILERRRKRVLVSDYSVGAWQITRETLRAAHALYLRDRHRRDYSLLPERLCPPLQLDLDSVNSSVLTTYAGLLLRELLDHFHGDVQKAIGAYNGGDKSPNPDYASAVASIAQYARRVLEHAPLLKAPDSAKQLTINAPSDQNPGIGESPRQHVDP